MLAVPQLSAAAPAGSFSQSDVSEQVARAFLDTYGALFGASARAADLSLLVSQPGDRGRGYVRFRFRIGSDASWEDYGWFIDDVSVYTCSIQAPPTPTASPTATTTGTSSPTVTPPPGPAASPRPNPTVVASSTPEAGRGLTFVPLASNECCVA